MRATTAQVQAQKKVGEDFEKRIAEKSSELRDIINYACNMGYMIDALKGLRQGLDMNLKGAVLIKTMLRDQDSLATEIKSAKDFIEVHTGTPIIKEQVTA